MLTESIIKIVDGSKSFKNQKVLQNISLECRPGKIYGIIGRNGSGKTVLFKCICGFLKLDEGEIRVEGKKMGQDLDLLTNSGIIIEEPAFLKNENGYKNLEYLYMINNKKNRDHLIRILNKVGLDALSKKKVGNYSMGMRQRLAIAQAIMEDKEILILDEPMNGLDNQGVLEMRELFLELKACGKTILLASHNKEDINVLCDEVYEIDRGIMKRF
ncbi:MAG: hypothetical protein RHS_3159 [Robinsoniella sp. RHS]|uniref:ABC transporter ATP-binding protein n=1 Tax=Robinsoniella sp. RHS TaxID=1504536 RepID=UPI0006497C7C|nr:MAG: hypothetical protein RHS_3159 [Robinsoniella sp. RHS]